MGMTSDQNETLTFAELREQCKREVEQMKEAKNEGPCYISIGVIKLNKKIYQLLVGEDNKWYKAERIGQKRLDEKNNTPLINVFSKEVTPLTEKEFNSYFG